VRIGSFMPAGSHWAGRLESLRARFPGQDFVIDPARSRAEVASLDIALAGGLDRSLFEAARALKALFVPFAGLNHLPVELLRERGVRVFNAHGNAEYVAERALALTLAFFGRVVEYHNDLRDCSWHGIWVGRGSQDEWSSIRGRRCAVFGTGAIGQALARLLKAFDCPVLGYRRRADDAPPPGFDRIEADLAAAVEWGELLFVTLPLTPSTEGLLSKELLLAARGKFLVNVGRGAVVDEEGLYLALKDGVLRGAAIDTWYTYPEKGAVRGQPSRFPIHELPNVILSPHVAGSCREAVAASAEAVIENLASFLATGRAPNEVDLREMY
jgi:phosphoglycerate dehydrogenase-like enzyme